MSLKDVESNFYNLCLSIMNLKGKQEGQPIDDHVLKIYISKIDVYDPFESLVVDQLLCIKQLISRDAFSFTDK